MIFVTRIYPWLVVLITGAVTSILSLLLPRFRLVLVIAGILVAVAIIFGPFVLSWKMNRKYRLRAEHFQKAEKPPPKPDNKSD